MQFHTDLEQNWTLKDVPLPVLPPKKFKLFGFGASSRLRDERATQLSAYLAHVSNCKY